MSLVKLKKALGSNKVVFGLDRTLKNLNLGRVKTVFLAGNCPDEVRDKIKSYKVEVIELKEENDELSLICKRPHSVSVISV